MTLPDLNDDAQPQQLEVRLLRGTHALARCVVDLTSPPVTLGAGWDNTVVLRDAGLHDGRLVLDGCTPDGVSLRVLEGSAPLAGQDRSAGDRLTHPLYKSLEIGAARVAFGRPDVKDWSCAGSVSSISGPRAPSAGSHWRRWSAGLGATVAVLAIVVFSHPTAVSRTPGATDIQPIRIEDWRTRLKAAGYPDLSVEADPNGIWHIGGHLESADQRTRLERMVAAQNVPAQVDAWVNEALAADLVEVLRVNGVRAEAQVRGRGQAQVTTHITDATRLAHLKALLQRDVPGVLDVVMNSTALASDRPPSSTRVDDPGKRVASVVPGDPPYVVTADGTRYFQGALLPTGQRIESIREREVALTDVSGAATTLRF